MSQYFFKTLRENPSDAEVASHQLLVRASYIRRQAPGIFAWMPLGLRLKANIERIIHEEMQRIGAHHVHFPALLPREPYEATGRWTEYGDSLFRLKDRHGADYLLAPTHEEVFTTLVNDIVTSYKDLPLQLYQIQDKYRDEARPRAGLLRGREFTMKDAYSFGITDADLEESYQQQRAAYERIFQRLGLEYVIVSADAGAMGGSKSEEFLLPIEIGEDTFVCSDGGYAANVEAYRVPAQPEQDASNVPAVCEIDTPNTGTIEKIVGFMNEHHKRADGENWAARHTLKNVVLAITNPEGERRLVIIGIPGDRNVDDKRLEVAFPNCAIEAATDDDFKQFPQLVRGYIGPGLSPDEQLLGEKGALGITYLVDPRVTNGTEWVTGANRADTHVMHLVCGRDFVPDGFVDVANVVEGDPAPDGSGPIYTARGMEIGHVFQLGRKYAEALGLRVLDENGKLQTVTMGSYGIGVTRIAAALAEVYHDDRGLCWPASVAPYAVQVLAVGKDEAILDRAATLACELEDAGHDVLLDDRPKVSPGVKFSDAELLGMPCIVIVGRKSAEGIVEVWERASGQRDELPLAEVPAWVREHTAD